MIFAFVAILFVEDGVPYYIKVKGEKGKLKSKVRFAQVIYMRHRHHTFHLSVFSS